MPQLSTLPVIHQQMIDRKYDSIPFRMMNERELQLACIGLLFKISVITGWKMYENDTEQQILQQQFELKLKESYSNVNATEVEYAFRNSFVKDWGKSLNLALIDEVMQPYLSQRAEASRLEEQVMTKPKELPVPVEVITDEQRIADAKEIYLSTKNPLFIPVKIWELIKDSVTLSEQQKADIKRRAAVMVAEMAKDDKFLFKDKTEQQWINRVTKQLAVAVWWGNG